MTRDIKIFHILSTLWKLTLHYTDSWLDLTIWIASCDVKLDFCSSLLWPGRRQIVNGTSKLNKKKGEREKGEVYVGNNNMYKQMLQNSIKAERKNVALGNVYCRTGGHFLCNSPSKHTGGGIILVRSCWECSLTITWKSIVLFIWRLGKRMWFIVFKGKNQYSCVSWGHHYPHKAFCFLELMFEAGSCPHQLEITTIWDLVL